MGDDLLRGRSERVPGIYYYCIQKYQILQFQKPADPPPSPFKTQPLLCTGVSDTPVSQYWLQYRVLIYSVACCLGCVAQPLTPVLLQQQSLTTHARPAKKWSNSKNERVIFNAVRHCCNEKWWWFGSSTYISQSLTAVCMVPRVQLTTAAKATVSMSASTQTPINIYSL